jgi:hypothetical protein
MTERDLRNRMRAVDVPDRDGAEERGWRVAEAALRARPSTARARLARRRARRLAAVGAAAAAAAIALTPPGAAVGDWISDVVTRDARPARPALTSLPTGGRLLVEAARGAWVVRRDGSRRRLGDYREADWSPQGLFVVVAGGRQLAAVEPADGSVRWALARARPIRHPAWSPDGFRIAYLSGSELRVVAGDGTGDGPLARADRRVTPAWRPDGGHVLAYVDPRGRIAVAQADSGESVWRAEPETRPHELLWTADGRTLVAIAPTSIGVYRRDGGRLRTIALPDGARAGDGAIEPGTDTLALARYRPASGRGELVTYSLDGASERRLFAGSGAFDGVVWSPDGRWLVAGWPAADQWLLIRSTQVRQIQAIDGVRRQFDPGHRTPARSPRPSGWCCG